MSYPKGNWNPYGDIENSFIVDIKIKEPSGLELGHFVTYTESQYWKALRVIQQKFGLHIHPPEQNIRNEVPITMTAAVIKAEIGLPIEKKERLVTKDSPNYSH